jgi:hypothetical protein
MFFSIISIVRFGLLDIPFQFQGLLGYFSIKFNVIFGFTDIFHHLQGLLGYFSINSIVSYEKSDSDLYFHFIFILLFVKLYSFVLFFIKVYLYSFIYQKPIPLCCEYHSH